MKRALFAIATITLLTGCVNSDENLQITTARLVGNNIAPESVMILDVNRGITTVTWTASTPSGTVACASDDLLRNPLCRQQ